MRFRQLDRITQLELGKHIEANRYLSASEGYLKDHFPKFPVMPGVLMLEAMIQAGNWLVRATEQFTHSAMVLKEVRNVKFSGFVEPDQTLTVTADIKKQEGARTTVLAKGSVNGDMTVNGRLILDRYNLSDQAVGGSPPDRYLRGKLRQKFRQLTAAPSDDGRIENLSMRWMWIDRIDELIRGERIVATKNVTLTELAVDEYLPGFPVFPASLIIEGIALCGGILINDQFDFEERIVLAKINRATFHRLVRPGDTLTYTVTVERLETEGALVRGLCHAGEELLAEIELFLARVGDDIVGGDLFDPADTLTMLRLWGLYDVGRKPDGAPIQVPRNLLAAETRAIAALET